MKKSKIKKQNDKSKFKKKTTMILHFEM